MSDPPRVRLHISPLNPTLYDTVVNQSLQALVSDISYHKIPTDPDGGFGYLELPKAEADQLRKKFHGKTLRSRVMSIEEARPRKRKAGLDEPGSDELREQKRAAKAKKTALKQGEMAGVELPEGRHVKRAWTEPEKKKAAHKDKSESKRQKSKYTKDRELLFKLGKDSGQTKSDAASSDSKAKTGKPARSQVVHEFENSNKIPSFLRDESIKRTPGSLSFVDGQGWVDEAGTLIEPVKTLRKSTRPTATPLSTTTAASPLKIPKKPTSQPAQSSSSSSSTTSLSSGSASESESDVASHGRPAEASSNQNLSDTSGSESSDGEAEQRGTSDRALVTSRTPDQKAADAGPETTLTTETASPAAKDIHPLESLFKRPANPTPSLAPLKTGFNFFDPDADIDVNVNTEDIRESHRSPAAAREASGVLAIETREVVPQTPFTRHDLRMRGARSAAPTPDTAVFGPKTSLLLGKDGYGDAEEDDDDDDDQETGTPLPRKAMAGNGSITSAGTTSPGPGSGAAGSAPGGTSEFVKMFYEKRNENNDAWKARRREALKAQRQRENKKMGRAA